MHTVAGGCGRAIDSPHAEADGHTTDAHDHDTEHAEHDHEDHDHHDEESAAIELSAQALKNIRYEPFTVALGDYERKISVPGMIVERPGKSQIQVSAPLTGIVTRSYVIQGEAVAPDSPLFDLRLTHEELVSAQGVYLESIEALDVVNAELRRLESVAEGVIAGKFILEQKYERQKLEAKMRAQRQGLLLHGLSDSQIDNILKTRQLLQSLTIRAPAQDCPTCHSDHPFFHIQSLIAQVGQQVTAGDTLAVLADHCELYIEGTAFEEDGEALRKALENQTPLSADILIGTEREQALGGLTMLYVANQVDRESRALHFYIRLMNEVVLDLEDGSHRFVQWRFKPGQRVELSVPVEQWTERFVLPSDAVVTEGAESYVYRQSDDHFDRVPVHVEHRDKKFAVVADDGAVSPGDVVAAHGAFQIHLALKNQAGGGVDPHAGHSH
jgi:multidrug efflux pump subunit AcrA (membrane-fusion protein)